MNDDILEVESNENESTVIDDKQLFCILTQVVKKFSVKEDNLQSVIRMLNEEYGFDLDDMERDFTLTYTDMESGKGKKLKIDLAVFNKDCSHIQDNISRIVIVHDDKTKDNDKKKGIEATLYSAMLVVENCSFGLWTNGLAYHFAQKEEDSYGNDDFTDIADFPGEGETIEDIDRPDR